MAEHPFDDVLADLFAPVDEEAEQLTAEEEFILEYEEELGIVTN